ncbi:MAG: hypothetical protein KGZ83_05745 [Sulfuricella sp.]|nr:hypothetical protein [Sulfuricella sp.]
MSTQNLIVASFADSGVAGEAVQNLQKAGFDMRKLSVVTRPGTAVPGVAPEITRFEALNEMEPACFSCIPQERIPDYQSELRGNRLLLVAQGNAAEVDAARHVIDQTHPCEWDGKVGAAVFYGCME